MAVETYISRSSDDVHTDVLAGARLACYKARDAFYACIEKESSKKPTEIASVGLIYPVECKASRAEFVKSCRSSWVKHFDRMYCQNSRVQRLLDDKDSRKVRRCRFEFVLDDTSRNTTWVALVDEQIVC